MENKILKMQELIKEKDKDLPPLPPIQSFQPPQWNVVHYGSIILGSSESTFEELMAWLYDVIEKSKKPLPSYFG